MKRAQTNLIIILGMAVATFWALMNTFSYTATIGGSTNIRGRLVTTISSGESARLLFDQERRYALDRAILFTGLVGGGDPDTCLIPESYRYIDVADFLPFLPVPDFFATVDDETVVRYWKNRGELCIPDENDLIETVDSLLADYFPFSRASALAPSGSLQSETYLVFKETGGSKYISDPELSRPYLKHTYDVYYYLNGTVEFDPTDDPNLEMVSSALGETVTIENIQLELRSMNRTKLTLTDEFDVSGYNFTGCMAAGGKYLGVYSYKGEGDTTYTFDIGQTNEYCYDVAPSIRDSSVGSGDEIQIGTARYHVFIDPYGSLTGRSVYLEPAVRKVMELGKDWIYYDIRRDKFDFVDTRIGEINVDKGEIGYTFIPGEGERLCMNITAGRFDLTNYLSLLSMVGYKGGFPDLYSYSKDYVSGVYAGKYADYIGWQEYELEHRIDYILDAVTMKTLQVFVKEGETLGSACSSGDRCDSGKCVRDPSDCEPENIVYSDGEYYCGTEGYDSCSYTDATCLGITCDSGKCYRESYSYVFGGCPGTYNYICISSFPTCLDGIDVLYYDFCTGGKVPRCDGNVITCYTPTDANCASGTLVSGTCQCELNSCTGVSDGCTCHPTATCPSGYSMEHFEERTIDSTTYPAGYYCKKDLACNLRTVDQSKVDVREADCECFATEDLILPKQDWLTRLIWNMGLEGTDYTYDDMECAKYNLTDVEVFNCAFCPNEECENMFDAALRAEFFREFEEVSPAKLEALTGYPWRIKLKSLYVNVTDHCTGESRQLTYSADYSFNPTGRAQAAGLPIQLLFAENSTFEVTSPYSCEICKNLNEIGSICLSGTDDEACDCNVVRIGVNDIQMVCNANNFCCLPTHDETIRDINGRIISPCCRLITPGICVKYQPDTLQTYECYYYDESENLKTRDIIVKEECAPAYGPYGKMEEIP